MKETGKVIQATGKTATVQLTRRSACGGNCASCGVCPYQTTEMTLANTLGARPGDTVEIELNTNKVYQAAFLVYILPLVCFFFSYFLCSYFCTPENFCILAGLLAAAACFLIIRHWSKKKTKNYMPHMERIL